MVFKRIAKALDVKTKIKFAIFIFLLVFFIFATKYFGQDDYIDIDLVRKSVEKFGAFGPIFFIALYAVSSILLIPGTLVTIVGGAIFGIVWGAVYTIIGATIGAVFAFLTARYLGRDFVEYNLHYKFPKLEEYDREIEKNDFAVNLFLRLIPIFPFNFLNYALGLTKSKFLAYTLATFIGIIPGSFVVSYFGFSLSEFDIWNIIISMILFILLILIYPIYMKSRKHFRKKSRKK